MPATSSPAEAGEQPGRASAASSPPTSDADEPDQSRSRRRRSAEMSAASTARAIPRVAMPACAVRRRVPACGASGAARARRCRRAWTARRRTPAAVSAPSDVVCRASAARTAGLDTACSSTRSNSGLARPSRRALPSAGSRAPRSAFVRAPGLRAPARRAPTCARSRARRRRRLEVGAREHLGDDALDDLVLGERPRDGLGQRAREHAVDRACGLGRREHVHRHGLEPAARARACAARRRATLVRTIGSRSVVRTTTRAGSRISRPSWRRAGRRAGRIL